MKSARILLVLVLVTPGCVDADTARFRAPSVAAHWGCTQEDAPALEIVLASKGRAESKAPRPPYVRIEIARCSWVRLRGKAIPLQDLRGAARSDSLPLARAELVRPDRESEWLKGELWLDRAIEEGEVVGRYRFVARDSTRIEGSFRTRWAPGRVVCG